MTTIQTKLLPFKTNFEQHTVEEGVSLQEIYNRFVPAPINGSSVVLTVNNQPVKKELWNDIHITKEMVVGINVLPTGGSGGGNKAVATIVQVSILAAAVLTGGAAAAAGFGLAGIGWSVATVGLAMAATIAYNAIYKVPTQSNLNSASVKESKTQFIQSGSNAIDRFGVIPVNLGTNRMFPKQAALPFTEAQGKNNYLRQLFTYGYGKVLVTDRKIGETEIVKYSDYEIDDLLNGNLNEGSRLYSNRTFQENIGATLSVAAGWVERRSQTNTDEMIVEILFQRGLCKYDSHGNKNNQSVAFTIDTKRADEEWTDVHNHMAIPQQSITITGRGLFDRGGIVVLIHKETGVLKSFYGVDLYQGYSNDYFQIGYLQPWPDNSITYVDVRSSLVGVEILNATDFQALSGTTFSYYGYTTLVIAAGTIIKDLTNSFTVTNATTEAFSVTKSFKFPTPGSYDLRIIRNTPDSTSDTQIDEAVLSNIKSRYTGQNPVNQADISGSALYIKATDQLNGAIDQYNAVVSTVLPKGYDPDTTSWIDDIISSNPADLFRYVLQSSAFAKRLSDDRIDLTKLAEWWVYCNTNGYTYNRIIDYEASIDEVLNDICAAGFATISKVDGVYSVIIDNERPVISGLITPRNSVNYKGSLIYPEIPHGLRVQFRNADKGYELDERIVYDTGYDETNATLYERVEFLSCINADLAYKYAKRYFATVKLQPEIHTFDMDFENLTFNRGDRISFVNDVILVGVGQGRVTSLVVDDVDNPTVINGFKIDEKITVPSGVTNLGVRIRYSDGSGYLYRLLQTVAGVQQTFTFQTPLAYTTSFGQGSLCAFVEDGKELDLIVTEIHPSNDHSATITCIDYAPERFNPIGVIPEWESNITLREDFFAPLPPKLGGWIETDESVMLKNSDGSYVSRMVIPLINDNDNNVFPVVCYRPVGGTVWMSPNYLKREPEQVVLTGFDDNRKYDLEIRYQRSQQVSEALSITNVRFVGGSNPPANVQGFGLTVSGYTGLFDWLPNTDVDVDHYVIRYSNDFDNTMWRNLPVLADNIKGNRISLPIRAGVYLIKAVDILGNESVDATTIISTDEGAFNNVVETLQQDPTWSGTKVDVKVADGSLYLEDGETEGYYYFDPDTVDLGNVYEVMMSSTLIGWLEDQTSIRTVDSVRSLQFVRVLDSSVPWVDDIEMNLSEDGVNWSGWQKFTSARQQFQYAKFRLHLQTTSENYRPRIKELVVYLDMPDRQEHDESVEITDADAGETITYSGAFKANPAVNITVQDGAVDDRLEFVNKDRFGFTIRVFNATINGYVSRTFDWVATGYGRVLE